MTISRPSNLQIDYLDTHDGAFHFRGSDGQGQIEERTDVAIASDGVIVNGWLGAIIKVKSIGARFRVAHGYTPGILTSDTRAGTIRSRRCSRETRLCLEAP